MAHVLDLGSLDGDDSLNDTECRWVQSTLENWNTGGVLFAVVVMVTRKTAASKKSQ